MQAWHPLGRSEASGCSKVALRFGDDAELASMHHNALGVCEETVRLVSVEDANAWWTRGLAAEHLQFVLGAELGRGDSDGVAASDEAEAFNESSEAAGHSEPYREVRATYWSSI